MVEALKKKSSINSTKRLTLQPYQIDEKFNEMNIDKFISENSLKLFTRFGIDTSFLQYDPKSWDNHISFVNGKELIKSIKIVNDTAERGVKLMAEFNEALTVNEEQKQYVLQCVQEHRQMYPNCKKETLKKLY
ncbi:uncharacterized protein LOC126555325 [Aphis gossypii]|uniref:uncharacterized protein LOC126555325 n=1 Tax=Aphis gossypii TaxID=80765 RepID=UPI002158EEDD|nr:uncharacterized protein LOC126555325 [Aphis gossypii]